MAPEPPANGNPQRASFHCRKTVSAKKIEANRNNATRSTGPRTERGKRNSRFNAVTIGLFADHVAIPVCDEEEAEKDFASLLNEVHEEFRPVGFYEEWLVVNIAEAMWRLRRATRCENGSIKEAAIWKDDRDYDQVLKVLATDLNLLEDAEAQLRGSGTLSQETYTKILPLVEEQKRSEQGNETVSAEIDCALFLTCIDNRRQSLEWMYNAAMRVEGDRAESALDHDSLPPTEEMDRILRYEERMHRQMDWAMQRLRESQQQRLANSPAESALVPIPPKAEYSKRSQ